MSGILGEVLELSNSFDPQLFGCDLLRYEIMGLASLLNHPRSLCIQDPTNALFHSDQLSILTRNPHWHETHIETTGNQGSQIRSRWSYTKIKKIY